MERIRSEASRRTKARIAASAFALLAVAGLALAGAAPAAAATMDRIRETGRIRLGYRVDARPLSYRDDRGAAAGYAVALCERVVEEVKTELGLAQLAVEWVPTSAENRFVAVQQGEIDLLCGSDTATLARRKEVSFSIPVFSGGIGALLRTDASIRLQAVLQGGAPEDQPVWRGAALRILQARSFAVVAGSTAQKWLAAKIAELDVIADTVTVDGYDAGVQKVLDRSSDVFFGDRVLLLDAAARSPAAGSLMVLDRSFTVEPIALTLAKGDDDFRLAVDRALSRLFGSAQFGELYTKWFGEPKESTLTFYRTSALPD